MLMLLDRSQSRSNLTTLNMLDMSKTLSMSPGVFTLHTQTLFFCGKSKAMESMCCFTQRMARPSLSSVQDDAPLVRKPRQHGVAYPAYHVRWDIGLPYTHTHIHLLCLCFQSSMEQSLTWLMFCHHNHVSAFCLALSTQLELVLPERSCRRQHNTAAMRFCSRTHR